MRLRTVFVGQVLLLLPFTLAAPTMHRRDQGAASVAKRPRTTQRPARPTSPPTGPQVPEADTPADGRLCGEDISSSGACRIR